MIIKLLSCILGLFKMIIYKVFHWKNLRMSLKSSIYPSVTIQIGKRARLSLGDRVSMRRNCEINVRNDAIVNIGKHTFLNSGCIITAHKKIDIGENVEFGPNVLLFDHDHKFKDGYEAKEFECSEIVIGNNVWIGAGCIILRGTVIGDHSVVGAGCVVKGKVPNNSVLVQKRESEVRLLR